MTVPCVDGRYFKRGAIASLLAILVFMGTDGAHGEEEHLHIHYRLNAPLIVKQDEHPSGFVYELMKYVLMDQMKLVKNLDDFTEVPLARGVLTTANSNTTLFFNIIRSPEREAAFQWIRIPGVSEKIFLYARADAHISISDMRDLAKFSIGVVNGSSSVEFLKKNGGPTLRYDLAPNHESNVKKLLAKRVELIAEPAYNLRYLVRQMDLQEQIVPVLFLEKNDFYLVASKNFEERLFLKIKEAVEESAASPVYGGLVQKYKDDLGD